MTLPKSLPEGRLRFDKEKGWIINTPRGKIKLNYDNVKNFALKKQDYYITCSYHFNEYGQLCVWLYETKFSLSKSTFYDIIYIPTGCS